jgi:hypothetical protein
MSKAATFVLAFLLVILNPTYFFAQALCGTPSNDLICLIRQLYDRPGVTDVGLTLPNAAHRAHFDADFSKDATALTASVGTELTSLRLASPTSGILFVFDKSLGVVKRSTESYGPILGERAETIGRHRLFVAATYQFFPFSSLDGIDLNHIPAVYRHADTVNPDGTHRDSAKDPPSPGIPPVELEYVSTINRIDLKVHQVTFYVTYGLTSRIDLSAAVPILDVRMGVTSTATIVRTADTIPQPVSSQFYVTDPNSLLGRLYAGTGPAADCAMTNPPSCSGYFHYFDPLNPATSLTAAFSSFRTASGIGDAVFRVKATVLRHERAAAALGADVRVPSGDEKNFLGTGALGVKPFLSASYRARISPHADIGYEFNGSSILAGDLLTGQEGRLPDQLFYSGGVDAGVTKKLTLAVDLLGQRFYRAPGLGQGPFVDVLGVSHPDVPQTSAIHRSFNMDDLAVGTKFSPFGNLLLTGNVQFKLDDGGLRAKVVPLVGISYIF